MPLEVQKGQGTPCRSLSQPTAEPEFKLRLSLQPPCYWAVRAVWMLGSKDLLSTYWVATTSNTLPCLVLTMAP